eukprot:5679148-Amphidinium_carterae.1
MEPTLEMPEQRESVSMEATVDVPMSTAIVPWVDNSVDSIDGVPVSTLEAELELLMEQASPFDAPTLGEGMDTTNMS